MGQAIPETKRDHALLSCSGAHRWMICTPSARAEEEVPEQTSVYAEAGTLAHKMAELKLDHYLGKLTKRQLSYRVNKLKKDELYEVDMNTATDEYLDVVKKEIMSYSIKPFVSSEMSVDLSAFIPEGFGTADCVIIGGNALTVIDYKNGKGVEVEAKDNAQLRCYALGVYAYYKLLYDIKTIKTIICQPRINNVSSETLSTDELERWAETLKEKAEIAYKGEGERKAGDHCKFCRVGDRCKERSRMNLEIAGFIDKDPNTISADELGAIIKKGEQVEAWLKSIKERALALCLSGTEVKGYKAVEGRGKRVWTDEDKALQTLMGVGIKKEILYETKPLTLAKIEKEIGKAKMKEVESFIKKQPGKPTLVPESDKREAFKVQPDAKDVFK